MKNNPKYITDSILLEYIRGMLSPGKNLEVEQWLDANPGNKDHLEKIRKIWIGSSSFSSFDQIDIKKDWQLVRDRIGGGKKVAIKPVSRSIAYTITRIAAIALILTGTGYLIYFLAWKPDIWSRQVVVQTTGQKSNIDLPDGSKVFLNTGSSLYYPLKFSKKIRKVEITGEAWFEVAKDKNKPFIISADGAEIKVLGTSFNILSDSLSGRIVVSVVDGMVSFYPKGREQQGIFLTGNEEGIFMGDSLSEHPVTSHNFISWKTGILQFDRIPMDDVVKSLEKYYKVPVQLKGNELQNKTLTSVYDNQSLDEVLGELKLLLGISYHFKNDTLVIQME